MLVRGGGLSSGYVSTGFFGGKYLGTVIPLFSYFFFKSGLTLSSVVMVEVTKKVNASYRVQQIQMNFMTESQLGAVNAVYNYTLVAIL